MLEESLELSGPTLYFKESELESTAASSGHFRLLEVGLQELRVLLFFIHGQKSPSEMTKEGPEVILHYSSIKLDCSYFQIAQYTIYF